MNVGTICQRLLITVRRSDEVIRAAQLMRDRHVGYLVVVESHATAGCLRAVGVLTDRDIVVSVVAREVDPAAVRVGEIMTPNPVTVAESDTIEEALQAVRHAGVRRVPVVGPRGELVGVLSFDDLLKVVAGEARDMVTAIRTERQIEGRERP
jgi:CBS domain-containing protein